MSFVVHRYNKDLLAFSIRSLGLFSTARPLKGMHLETISDRNVRVLYATDHRAEASHV